jgi:hypothetical protein
MQSLTERFAGSEMESSPVKYVIYALAIGITVGVVIMIADNFYPFLPVNPISGPSAAARAGKTFWVNAGSENLVVPASVSPTVTPSNYSMSVQLMIGDSRPIMTNQFRHIVHRGSNPVMLTASTAGTTGHTGIKIGDLPPDVSPTYKNLGLPSIMNPGLFLDRNKNDLHVFVHTKGATALWLESLTIEDLPLATPLTIGVVCNGKTLEVYVNCKLYSTLLLKGTPYLPKADNQWFGRYGAFPVSGIVKDLTLWDTPLGTTDYALMCRSPSFDTANLPETCPTASS